MNDAAVRKPVRPGAAERDDGCEWGGAAAGPALEHRHRRRRQCPGRHLIEHGSEGEQIRARIQLFGTLNLISRNLNLDWRGVATFLSTGIYRRGCVVVRCPGSHGVVGVGGVRVERAVDPGIRAHRRAAIHVVANNTGGAGTPGQVHRVLRRNTGSGQRVDGLRVRGIAGKSQSPGGLSALCR